MARETSLKMFSGVAPRYDFLNRLLSFGLDILWRKKLVKLANAKPGEQILDIATGTGDVAIEFALRSGAHIVGVDFSKEMLELAKKKAVQEGVGDIVVFQCGDALNLPFKDSQFHAVAMAFGIRNLADYKKGIEEMKRVVGVGGRVLILEFSKPSNWIFPFYWLHLHFFIPLLGGIFSKGEAYRYLSNSILQFTKTACLKDLMEHAGLANVRQIPMSFGIVSAYIGHKSESCYNILYA